MGTAHFGGYWADTLFIVIFASQLVLDIVLGALILFMLYEFFMRFNSVLCSAQSD